MQATMTTKNSATRRTGTKENNMQAIINLAIVLMPIWVMLIAMLIKGDF